MRSLQLNVSEKAYEKLKVIFSLFGADDLTVEDHAEFLAHKKHLEEELAKIESGEGKMYSLAELEKEIAEMISEHESRV